MTIRQWLKHMRAWLLSFPMFSENTHGYASTLWKDGLGNYREPYKEICLCCKRVNITEDGGEVVDINFKELFDG